MTKKLIRGLVLAVIVLAGALGVVSAKLHVTTTALAQSKAQQAQTESLPDTIITRMRALGSVAGCLRYPDGSVFAGVTREDPKVFCDSVFPAK